MVSTPANLASPTPFKVGENTGGGDMFDFGPLLMLRLTLVVRMYHTFDEEMGPAYPRLFVGEIRLVVTSRTLYPPLPYTQGPPSIVRLSLFPSM